MKKTYKTDVQAVQVQVEIAQEIVQHTLSCGTVLGRKL